MTERALVLFSGGQDSTICLAWALEHFDEVETIGFDYRQRHHVELECRTTLRTQIVSHFPAWAPKLGADHRLDIGVLNDISVTSLTRAMDIQMQKNGLPNSFVPGRNLLFLTLAAALAYRQGIRHLIGGMGEADFSGYPDCRDTTLKALQTALNLGMESDFVIHTPLMQLNKADTWRLAKILGGPSFVELVRIETHTCYLGERNLQHAWGYGCDSCPACILRRNGYNAYLSNS